MTAQAQTVSESLPISVPPGATVSLEVDAHESDVLGLVKRLLSGITTAAVTPATATSTAASATTDEESSGIRVQIGGDRPASKPAAPPAKSTRTARRPKNAGPGMPPPASAAASAADEPRVGPLTIAQLTALLKDIHHLHVLSARAPKDAPSVLGFYEPTFTAEGGKRVLWSSSGPAKTQVLMSRFEAPLSGFALVIQQPSGEITVVRSDGYPNLEAIAPLVATFLPGASLPAGDAPAK